MAPARGVAALLLQPADLPSGARARGVKSDRRVQQLLAPHGCLGEATVEFRLPNAEVRASAEIYLDRASAAACFEWFTTELRRTHAEDSSGLPLGDVSTLFVTMILAGRKRVASYAACWVSGNLVGKVTTVGPADHLDKSLVVSLAGAQAERMAACQRTRQ